MVVASFTCHIAIDLLATENIMFSIANKKQALSKVPKLMALSTASAIPSFITVDYSVILFLQQISCVTSVRNNVC